MLQAPAPPPGYQSNLAGLYSQNAPRKVAVKPSRVIPQQPERVLDAPDIRDDYYLNLVDWSSTNQVRTLSSCNHNPSCFDVLSGVCSFKVCLLQWLF